MLGFKEKKHDDPEEAALCKQSFHNVKRIIPYRQPMFTGSQRFSRFHGIIQWDLSALKTRDIFILGQTRLVNSGNVTWITVRKALP